MAGNKEKEKDVITDKNSNFRLENVSGFVSFCTYGPRLCFYYGNFIVSGEILSHKFASLLVWIIWCPLYSPLHSYMVSKSSSVWDASRNTCRSSQQGIKPSHTHTHKMSSEAKLNIFTGTFSASHFSRPRFLCKTPHVCISISPPSHIITKQNCFLKIASYYWCNFQHTLQTSQVCDPLIVFWRSVDAQSNSYILVVKTFWRSAQLPICSAGKRLQLLKSS